MEGPTASEIVEAFVYMQSEPEMQTSIEQMFDVAEREVVFQKALASLTNRWKATQRLSVQATVRTALVMGIQMGMAIAEARDSGEGSTLIMRRAPAALDEDRRAQ